MSRKGDPLGLLALCRKAGKLNMGFDVAARSIGRGAKLLVFTADVSPKTRERMCRLAHDVPIKILDLPCTSDDVFRVVGKRAVVLSVADGQLAQRLVFLTQHHNEEELDI
jgi:ribosomal protein L30E